MTQQLTDVRRNELQTGEMAQQMARQIKHVKNKKQMEQKTEKMLNNRK